MNKISNAERRLIQAAERLAEQETTSGWRKRDALIVCVKMAAIALKKARKSEESKMGDIHEDAEAESAKLRERVTELEAILTNVEAENRLLKGAQGAYNDRALMDRKSICRLNLKLIEHEANTARLERIFQEPLSRREIIMEIDKHGPGAAGNPFVSIDAVSDIDVVLKQEREAREKKS